MIAGYCSHGMDNTVGYPGWMLGYWHAIVVAGGVDNLAVRRSANRSRPVR